MPWSEALAKWLWPLNLSVVYCKSALKPAPAVIFPSAARCVARKDEFSRTGRGGGVWGVVWVAFRLGLHVASGALKRDYSCCQERKRDAIPPLTHTRAGFLIYSLSLSLSLPFKTERGVWLFLCPSLQLSRMFAMLTGNPSLLTLVWDKRCGLLCSQFWSKRWLRRPQREPFVSRLRQITLRCAPVIQATQVKR